MVGVALAGVFIAAFGFARTMTAMGVVTLLLAPTLFSIPHLSDFFRRAPQEAAGYLEALYPGAFAAEEQGNGLASCRSTVDDPTFNPL